MEEVMQHTAYDWSKDIIIPLTGAILIPIAIAFFTWWFGASRAEQQKELRQLRDNLNLLLSVCFDALEKLATLRKSLLKVEEIEQSGTIDPLSDKANKITNVYISPIDFSIIKVANYSRCIAYSENYVLTLLRVMSAIEINNLYLENRNSYVRAISSQNTLEERIRAFCDVLGLDKKWLKNELNTIESAIIFIHDFIKETKDLENKIKKLKLDSIKYSDENLQSLREIENKYQLKGVNQ